MLNNKQNWNSNNQDKIVTKFSHGYNLIKHTSNHNRMKNKVAKSSSQELNKLKQPMLSVKKLH